MRVVRRDFDINVEPIGKHFSEYLKRTYEKNSILNTLVYRNQQKLLRDLYIPLTLVPDGVEKPTSNDMVKIDGYPRSLIEEYRRVLITDTAGMGKSTLTKVMFLSAIDKEEGIPIYIELRKLSKKHPLIEEIRDQLDSLTKEFDDTLMLAFFRKGGFIFFFDGFDEINLADRKEVTEDMKLFIEKAPNNYFFLTSRFEQALAGFGDFRAMRIQPLKKNEAYSLLRKYDAEGETSARLIERLKSGEYDKIDDFLKNPLLVSLLFIGFEYKPEVPLKVHLFYDQVFEAYFNNHDLSKDGYYTHEKLSGLDMADFGKVLRAIGYICLKEHRLEFSRNDFLDIIEKAGKLSSVPFSSSDALLNDLLHAVPLFCQDGVDYKWVHKSMQEYYAADFINRDIGEKKEQLLKSIANSLEINYYINLLDFYADLDIRYFQQVFVLPILNDFISFIEKPVNTTDPDFEKRIRRRRQIMYGRDSYLYLFTREESKMSLSSGFDMLRSLVSDNNTSCIISHSSTVNRGIVYTQEQNYRLIRLITKRFPQLLTPVMSNLIETPKHLKAGVLYHYTEDLKGDNMEAFDEVDSMATFTAGIYMNYKKAKELKGRIDKEIKESECVLNDLLVL